MNVLSLFDGISACHLALTRAGHTVGNYYTSEIDKYAEKVSMSHYPDAVRLGDVTKWQEWDIDWASIDLVTGGFPCQAWSVAGKQLGDKDERGMLFWTMLDIMKQVLEHNPLAYFLMENVKMKKEFEQYITHHTEQALGHVNKHLINSALLSAQNRNRYYWTNIEGVTQPKDKGILLKDIIESGFADRDKSLTVTTRVAGATAKRYLEKSMHQMVIDKPVRTGIINKGGQGDRIYSIDGKSITIGAQSGGTAGNGNTLIGNQVSYRKLTPTECERLQTFPDGWTVGVSNTQRYKMLGNGWTVDVIAHIFNSI